jgi:hypothetical protein
MAPLNWDVVKECGEYKRQTRGGASTTNSDDVVTVALRMRSRAEVNANANANARPACCFSQRRKVNYLIGDGELNSRC